MIKQETAGEVWECYREIAASEKLLADMEELREQNRNERNYEPQLKDAFGRRQDLQLGIPSGDNCHRLFGVSPKLAESVIRAHIAEKQAALVAVNERARIELGASAPVAQQVTDAEVEEVAEMIYRVVARPDMWPPKQEGDPEGGFTRADIYRHRARQIIDKIRE